MEPINKHELLKFLAVLIAMGIDHKQSVKDYWSLVLCFPNMFKWDRFETIYHTMFHASVVNTVSKEKYPIIKKPIIQDKIWQLMKWYLDGKVTGDISNIMQPNLKSTTSRLLDYVIVRVAMYTTS